MKIKLTLNQNQYFYFIICYMELYKVKFIWVARYHGYQHWQTLNHHTYEGNMHLWVVKTIKKSVEYKLINCSLLYQKMLQTPSQRLISMSSPVESTRTLISLRIPRCTRSTLNKLRTEYGQCRYLLQKWGSKIAQYETTEMRNKQ